MLAVHLLLSRTRAGKAMRAMADSPDLARLTGIDTERVIRTTWIVGASLAAAAGVFLAYDTHVETQMGFKCCCRSSPPRCSAASVGHTERWRADGERNDRGTLDLSVDRHRAAAPAGYKAGVAFAIMVVILIWRPSGCSADGYSEDAPRALRGDTALMDQLYGIFLYTVFLLTMGGIYAVLALGLNIQWGLHRIVQCGVAGFFAIGAYVSAILTSVASTPISAGFGLNIPVGICAAMIASAIVAWGIGRIAFGFAATISRLRRSESRRFCGSFSRTRSGRPTGPAESPRSPSRRAHARAMESDRDAAALFANRTGALCPARTGSPLPVGTSDGRYP